MGTVSQLSQLGFTPNQAKHLGIDGFDVLLGGWTPGNYVNPDSPYDVTPLVGTYSSSNSFYVPGDLSSYTGPFEKIKFINNTQKYGYVQSAVYSAGVTTFTLVPNVKYPVQFNADVTEIYFSREVTPYNFPDYLTWTPAPTSSAGTGTYTISNARFSITGKTVHGCLYTAWTQASSAHAQVTINLPVRAKNNTVGQFFVGVYTEAASGTTFSNGFIFFPSNSTTATVRRDLSSTVTWPIAAGLTNYIVTNFFYEAQ